MGEQVDERSRGTRVGGLRTAQPRARARPYLSTEGRGEPWRPRWDGRRGHADEHPPSWGESRTPPEDEFSEPRRPRRAILVAERAPGGSACSRPRRCRACAQLSHHAAALLRRGSGRGIQRAVELVKLVLDDLGPRCLRTSFLEPRAAKVACPHADGRRTLDRDGHARRTEAALVDGLGVIGGSHDARS